MREKNGAAGPDPQDGAVCTLRVATEEDLAALLPMMVDFNRFESIPWDPVAGTGPLRRLLGEPALGRVMLIYKAGRAGAPAGYAVVTYGYDLEYGGRDAVLTELYLVPEARGQGIGQKALDLLLKEAAALGARALHLQVRPDNTAAQRLYRAAGFTATTRHYLTRRLTAS